MIALRMQSLDRRDLSASDGTERSNAGACRPSSDVDGAGAAHTYSAAELRALQADIVANDPEERRIGLFAHTDGASVDPKVCRHVSLPLFLVHEFCQRSSQDPAKAADWCACGEGKPQSAQRRRRSSLSRTPA